MSDEDFATVPADESRRRWAEIVDRDRAGELQAGFFVVVNRDRAELHMFAHERHEACPVTLEGIAALQREAKRVDFAVSEFAGDLWHAGAFGDPMTTPPPEGIAIRGAWAADLIAKWWPAPALAPEDESPKAEALRLLEIVESHVGTARVAVDVGHLGRLHEEITRAIGTLRQVSRESGAGKLADAVTTEMVTRMRCHACERPFYAAPGPEERGPQRTASMHLVVATRRRSVRMRELDVGEYPHVCSFECFDKIIASWPAHPRRDKILAEYPKRRSYRNELYGVQYVGEQLLEDVADAHLAHVLERSGG